MSFNGLVLGSNTGATNYPKGGARQPRRPRGGAAWLLPAKGYVGVAAVAYGSFITQPGSLKSFISVVLPLCIRWRVFFMCVSTLEDISPE